MFPTHAAREAPRRSLAPFRRNALLSARRWSAVWPLIVILGVGLGLRLLVWGRLPRTGWISDEGEYLSAAFWLAHGRGFTWYFHYWWTRAPLYPMFLALHLWIFGNSLTPIYLSQMLLSLANIVLVYRLAYILFLRRRIVAVLAALLMASYFPFVIYPQVLLSETLYITLLLLAFVALSRWQPGAKGHRTLVAAGIWFGLATLTRSMTILFLPLVAVWIVVVQRGFSDGMRLLDPCGRLRLLKNIPLRGLLTPVHHPLVGGLSNALMFLAGASAAILPWTVYNSRLYGGPVIVDTSGAFNVLLAAKMADEGKRNDASTRDYVLGLFTGKEPASVCAPPYPGQLAAQAARQAAMSREGMCLIARSPLAFIGKSLQELIDLFQINYSGDERFTNGFTTGRLPPWYTLGLFLLDDTLYIVVLPLAVLGWSLVRRAASPSPVTGLIGLWLLYNILSVSLLFAINRFRLPLLPFAFIFGAYALAAVPGAYWHGLRSFYGRCCAALALLLLLISTTPYAYLWPENEQLPSYLGPHPSSLYDTVRALAARSRYQATEQLRQALQHGDAATARKLLESGDISVEMRMLGEALLASLEHRYDDGLRMLPSVDAHKCKDDFLISVVRGELLRSKGDLDSARIAFGPTCVDNNNPVEWAWEWLRPAPARRIDLGGDLDLGYISGCYLGQGEAHPSATYRWCTDGAQLRFPSAGTGAPQQLVLRVDSRSWFDNLSAPPLVRVLLGGQEVGSFKPLSDQIAEYSVWLPASPQHADIVVTLRTPTFISNAEGYRRLQGALVGQVQQLGVRLDWVELRD